MFVYLLNVKNEPRKFTNAGTFLNVFIYYNYYTLKCNNVI